MCICNFVSAYGIKIRRLRWKLYYANDFAQKSKNKASSYTEPVLSEIIPSFADPLSQSFPAIPRLPGRQYFPLGR